MAEYWVSQAKHHCDFCKCWIADNRPSRDFHEKGKRHQENVRKKIDQVRKSSVAKAKAEEEMSDSLRQMEENALKALKRDLMANPSLASQYGITLKPKEPEVLPQFGPEPRPQSSEADAQSSSSSEGESEGSEEETEDDEATTGTWHMAASDEGYPYYWNDITAEVQWVAPAAYLAQQEKKKKDSNESDNKPKKDRKSKKSSTKATKPPPKTEEESSQSPPRSPVTEDQLNTDEPVTKKAKMEDPPALADIPLPGDIPLPPPPGEKDYEKEAEKNEDGEEENHRSEARRPKSHASYGTWEQIEETPEDVEPEDMGLPQVAERAEPTITVPVPEARFKFREKTVSSLGSGPVFFKKPKKKMTAAQFLKKREES